MVKLALLVSALVLGAEALVQSPSYQFNVTSPAPNAPYVASQILPCIYDVAANSTSDNLQLSITLVGSNYSAMMTGSADISLGFSFEKQISGATVYEHQFNYHIPANTTSGAYEVVFADNVSQTNVSIPITIAAAPVTPSSSSLLPSASATPAGSSPTASIFRPNPSSAASSTSSSKYVAGALAALVISAL